MNLKSYASSKRRAISITAAAALTVTGASFLVASPASAHEFCDADVTSTVYNDDGTVSQVEIVYTTVSDIGDEAGAEDGLCQVYPAADCSDGEVVWGELTNGNYTLQSSMCADGETLVSWGWATVYGGEIYPA